MIISESNLIFNSEYMLIFNTRLFNNVTCEATANYRNTEFLPVSVISIPQPCDGLPFARIHISPNTPNGIMSIGWYFTKETLDDKV